ncbi:hypothetical protein BC830DRAFT_629946 [Chytriomyces sp. MP71]|nr:hypothetical protein BC830DRAFT_629946 [Chytriomyces sp. MP71]
MPHMRLQSHTQMALLLSTRFVSVIFTQKMLMVPANEDREFESPDGKFMILPFHAAIVSSGLHHPDPGLNIQKNNNNKNVSGLGTDVHTQTFQHHLALLQIPFSRKFPSSPFFAVCGHSVVATAARFALLRLNPTCRTECSWQWIVLLNRLSAFASAQ